MNKSRKPSWPTNSVTYVLCFVSLAIPPKVSCSVLLFVVIWTRFSVLYASGLTLGTTATTTRPLLLCPCTQLERPVPQREASIELRRTVLLLRKHESDIRVSTVRISQDITIQQLNTPHRDTWTAAMLRTSLQLYSRSVG